MSCGVGCRHGLDPPLLWLWHRQVASAPIGPLAWKPPYAVGMALKRQKKKKKRKENALSPVSRNFPDCFQNAETGLIISTNH